MDADSSVNILFKEVFNRMELTIEKLQPVAMPLFGFTGHEVKPWGQISLLLSLGEEPLRQTRIILFIVVEAPSIYNTILGRPTLPAFQAMTSPYH